MTSQGAGPALLLGADHTTYGDVYVADVGPTLAAAISRGAFPKGYPHVDANEDAAVAAGGAGAWLLAVADGHNGIEASHAAARAIASAAPWILDAHPERRPDELDAAVAGARGAVAAATRGHGEPRRSSATALTVVLVSDGGVWIASAGDTVALRVRRRTAGVLTRPAPFLDSSSPATSFHRGTARVRPGDALVLLTDGVYGFLGARWERIVTAFVRQHESPRALVGELADSACASGAGDNLAVVALYL